ncbi:MAG: hypothetical protein NXH74_07770, partial [Rhodobacteraceae bacterium]|nr:hypothetical protein [Paracoccaceae bacterium]
IGLGPLYNICWNARFCHATASGQPNPKTALYLPLHGVGWRVTHRVRMVCTAGPFQMLTEPRRSLMPLNAATQAARLSSAPMMDGGDFSEISDA